MRNLFGHDCRDRVHHEEQTQAKSQKRHNDHHHEDAVDDVLEDVLLRVEGLRRPVLDVQAVEAVRDVERPLFSDILIIDGQIRHYLVEAGRSAKLRYIAAGHVKGGIGPEDTDALITECRETLELPIEGLMCIPPLDEEPSLYFALLGEIAKRNGLENLSMGMSGDFETAIRFGATHVRVGTALFGERPPFKPG